MAAAEEPKIIIDTDWKSQAQAEKERLAQKSAAAVAAKPVSAPVPGAASADGVPQEVRFEDLIGLLATQALSYLGYFEDPQTGQAVVSLEYAKLHIDMLSILAEKTKGNLTAAEEQAVSRTLDQLRMNFVGVSKAVAKAVQEGRLKSVPAGAGPGGAPAAPPPAIDFSPRR
mgnify:CR=1 FL=1